MSTSTRILLGFLALWLSVPATYAPKSFGQLSGEDEERLKLLTEPDAKARKAEKDKNRPPFEFFRSQVAPFDVLPYIKPNHWNTFSVDLKANNADYAGLIQTEPLRMREMPQQLVYEREARLVKEQRATLSFQILGGEFPREMEASLIKPGAIRPEEVWQAGMLTLPQSQMLVMILSRESGPRFAAWSRLPATVPSEIPFDDPLAVELGRYYRIVVPADSNKINLSPHPLAWSTLSHVIWDGLSPDTLSVSQQRAMIDWIHWGGQLVITGGANATATLFRESFLAPYLPGERTGETTALGTDELAKLSRAFRPSSQLMRGWTSASGELEPYSPELLRKNREYRVSGRRYHPPRTIDPRNGETVHFAAIRPNPGATTIPLAGSKSLVLGVESRVGRGRITMLSFNPNEPALMTWPGIDTLIRRVVLRRPEEPATSNHVDLLRTRSLAAPDLSWYRIAARDGLGIPDPSGSEQSLPHRKAITGVADWDDGATIPLLARDTLEEASGITIPSSRFVLKVMLAYIVTLVPLNWLFCRFVLKRREWSWVLIPLLSLAFAIGVERVAAFDVGFDAACDEVDLLEYYGNYERAHLSRFASLFSTGRGDFSLAFPNDPTAVALPFDNGRSIGGEDIATSYLRTYPSTILSNMIVQPRSLGMVRTEQMLNVGGGFEFEDRPTPRVTNRTDLELRDAVLVRFDAEFRRIEHALGDLAPGATVELNEDDGREVVDRVEGFKGPDPSAILRELRRARELRPENAGEVRLVGWAAQTIAGMKVEPEVDRHRGVTVVLAHLGFGTPPDPAHDRYNAPNLGVGPPPAPTRGADEKPAPKRATPEKRREPDTAATATGPAE